MTKRTRIKVTSSPLPQDDDITKQVIENVRYRHNELTKTVRPDGGTDYVLHVDPVAIGMAPGQIGGDDENKKAAPEISPRRPTFNEFLEQLNERNK